MDGTQLGRKGMARTLRLGYVYDTLLTIDQADNCKHPTSWNADVLFGGTTLATHYITSLVEKIETARKLSLSGQNNSSYIVGDM